jgi:hypothetical protein
MKMLVSIEGDLGTFVAAELEKGARVATNAVRQAARGVEKDLEAATARAGLGKLARSWQSRVYPDGPSLGASGLVYAKGGARTVGALIAYATGVRIVPRFGKYLWVPTEAVIKREGAKIGPRDFEEAGIPLRFVPPKGARRWPLLVADGFVTGRRANSYRVGTARRIKSGRGIASVVMFIGVRSVDVAKRFDIEAVASRGHAELAGRIAAIWDGTVSA